MIDPIEFAKVQQKVREIAADARAWASEHGVAGGDDAEAAQLLLTAAELIRAENGAPGQIASTGHAAVTADEMVGGQH